MIYVSKRDGNLVPFDSNKIKNAIYKALDAERQLQDVQQKDIEIESIAQSITNLSIRHMETFEPYKSILDNPDGILNVEDIQDVVETILMKEKLFSTAKKYILYRYQHMRMRNKSTLLEEIIPLIRNYGVDWRTRENANMSFSLQGLNNHITTHNISNYWLSLLPEEVGDAHSNAFIHIHDLGTFGSYCAGWDLKELLTVGFRNTKCDKVTSDPPMHFKTALNQIVNALYTLQGEFAGAQAISNFDTLLAPFVAFDKLTYNEVKQAMQEFIFNMNVPTRTGYQSCFSNITMDLVVSPIFANQPVTVGRHTTVHKYSEFQKEMDMINRAFCEVMYSGDAKGKSFPFPIPTYNISDDFNWDNPELEILWKLTGKFGTPYFCNLIGTGLKADDFTSMCCRLRIDRKEIQRKGGVFGSIPKTGSLGVVTLNLPQMAYLSKVNSDTPKEAEDLFFSYIKRYATIAKVSLELKRKILDNAANNGLYPYSMFYLQDTKDRFGSYWANHFSTIGIVGMNEACLNLLGDDIASKEGYELAIKTLTYLRNTAQEFQIQTGNLYNFEATPAEGASFRLALHDKTYYDDIITAGDDNTPYYTNSSHLPVDFDGDVAFALKHQEFLQGLYTGGTVWHFFVGERLTAQDVKSTVNFIANNYKLPYYTITPSYSVCPVHGYIPGVVEKCPYHYEEEEA